MITTITCNPAIDKTINENGISYTIGGKGINVSKCLAVLEAKSTATGFLGEVNGELVLNDLNELNIPNHFIFVKGSVRTNTKTIIKNELYEENEEGPIVDRKQQIELLEYIKTIQNQILVISGSLPKGICADYYKKIINIGRRNNCIVILDTSKDFLKEGIEAIPDIIKPNKKEICEYFGIKYDKKLIIDRCKELINKGIKLVVVSLGEQGALFIFKDIVYEVPPIRVNYVSSLCAGDSLVAGIAYAKEKNLNNEEMLKLAIACASCSVEEVSIFKDKKKVCEYMKKVRIEVIE